MLLRLSCWTLLSPVIPTVVHSLSLDSEAVSSIWTYISVPTVKSNQVHVEWSCQTLRSWLQPQSGFSKWKQSNTIATWKDFILAILISLLQSLFCRMTFLDSYISSCPHNSLIHGFAEKGKKYTVELQTQELGSYSMFPRKHCTPTNIWQREICSLHMRECQWAVGECHVTGACFKNSYAFALRREKITHVISRNRTFRSGVRPIQGSHAARKQLVCGKEGKRKPIDIRGFRIM